MSTGVSIALTLSASFQSLPSLEAARRPRSPTPTHLSFPQTMRRRIFFPATGMNSLHVSPSFEITTNGAPLPTVTGSPPIPKNSSWPNARPRMYLLYLPSLLNDFHVTPSLDEDRTLFPPYVPTATYLPLPKAAAR